MFRKIYILTLVMLASIMGFSQKTIEQMYGQQLPNSTFEGAWNKSETAGWNSFATAKTIWLTGSAVTQDQSGPNSEIRPGSSGIQSARVNARSVAGIAVANGTLTTGRINAGSISAKDVSKNYNYTIRNDNKYRTSFTAKPDSISLWVKFTTSNVDQEAHIAAFLHSNALDFQDAPSRKEDRDNIAGVAIGDFKRSYVNNTATWKRVTVPFKYDSFVSYIDYSNAGGANNEKEYTINSEINPEYIIVTVSTNKYPGGNANDVLLFDDILMVYKPELKTGVLSNTYLQKGSNVSIPYSLVGTMSPYNLNSSINQVIAEISDANGSFTNARELGRITSDVSGTITCNIPSNLPTGTGYRVRVRSTNYPMVAEDNGTNLSVYSNLYTVSMPINPTGYSVVAESGYVTPTIDGSNFKFKVNLDAAYSQSNITVKANEATLTAVAGVYTITNIQANQTITVTGVVLNKYAINLPSGEGYTVTEKAGYSSPVTHGGSYSFSVSLDLAYNNSPMVVRANGIVIPNNSGVYTISNISAIQNVTVEGITINKYNVVISTGNGYTTVAESGSTSPVNYGGDYSFRVNLNEAYSNSVITVNSNGSILNSVNGVYTIKDITANQTVAVTGAIMNKYTISWTNPAAGNITVRNGTSIVNNGSQVNHGAALIVTLNPYAGYAFESLTINGNSFANGAEYIATQNTAITATVKLSEYSITWTNPVGANIEVIRKGETLVSGDDIAYNDVLTITAIAETGYTINQVKVNGVSITNGSNYVAKGDVAIEVATSINKFAVSWTNATGATIEVKNGNNNISSGAMINYGTELTITATASDSHNITSLKVNGADFTSGNNITVTTAISVAVTTTIKTYTITVNQTANGQITPATTVLNYGAVQGFNINANEDYSVSDVIVDGVSVGKRTSYTFTNVTADHSISATFEYTPDMFNITLPSVAGAIIEAIDGYESPVIEGSDFKFTVAILPSHNKSIAVVKVNDTPITAVNDVYTISNISAHQTVSVEGVNINTYDVTLPTAVGATIAATNGSVSPTEYGSNFTFNVTLNPEYSASKYVVSANGTTLSSNDGNFVVENIMDNINITITDVELNYYSVTFPTVIGATINAVDGYDNNRVNYGENFKFTVTLDAAYSNSDFMVEVDGEYLTMNSGVFTIEDIRENKRINISAVKKNVYSVTLPTVIGATISALNGYDVNNVEYGDDFKFTVYLDDAYSQSAVVVTVGGTIVPLVDGVYTINEVKANSIVAVSDVELNKYAITMKETEGAIFRTALGFDAANVMYGSEFKFYITIAPAYSQSPYFVQANGVVLTLSDGLYTIHNVTEDMEVEVSNVIINNYTITLPVVTGATIVASNTESSSVNYGENFTFNVTLDAAYNQSKYMVYANSLPVSPKSVSGNESVYEILNVRDNTNVTISSLTENVYTLSVLQSSNGLISPITTTVTHGGEQTFGIVANVGYFVKDVKIDGVSVGSVESYTFENVTANHSIEAEFALNMYTITVTQSDNGTISPSNVTANYGSSRLFTITPNANYHITDVIVDGVSIGVQKTFTFTNITEAHTITATFAINTYNITVTQSANGNISPNTTVVSHGNSETFTITPESGYKIAKVKVDGINIGEVANYTFSNVNSSHSITAIFEPIVVNKYSITASAGTNGTISPAGVQTLNEGENCTFTFTPDSGYKVGFVLVDGIVLQNIESYTFENIDNNHSIRVEFVSTVGVESMVNNEFSITSYENRIQIKTAELTTNGNEAFVYDISGKLIYRGSIESEVSTITIEKQGTYIVNLVSENTIVKTAKVIIR